MFGYIFRNGISTLLSLGLFAEHRRVVRGVCDSQCCVARCVVSYYLINTRATIHYLIYPYNYNRHSLGRSALSVPYGESEGQLVVAMSNAQGILLTVIIHNTDLHNFTPRLFVEFNVSRVAPFPIDFFKAPHL